MIKINLALKKQASYVGKTAPQGGKSNTLTSIRNMGSGSGASELVPALLKILLPIGFCAAAYFGSEMYMEQKNNELQQEVATVDKERERIQTELKRIKGFEIVKAELEKNAVILKNKTQTIEKLIRGRDFTVKTLVMLAQSLPREIWLTQIMATETGYSIQGATTDLGLVSDLMTKLGQTIYFKDVMLKNSTLDTNGRIANFELSARRD